MDTNSTESSITTKSAELTLKRKRKRARNKAKRKESKQRVDQMLKNPEAPGNEESSIEDVASSKNSDAQLLPLGHLEIGTELAKSLSLTNAVGKKRRKKRRKARNKKQTDVLSNPSPLGNKHGEEEIGLLTLNITTRDSVKEPEESELPNRDDIALSSNVLDVSAEKFPTEKSEGQHGSLTGVRKKEVKTFAQEEKHDPYDGQAKRDNVEVANDTIEGEVSLSEARRISAESCSITSQLTHHTEMHVHLGPRSKRKLLILDVNGLLADIVNPPPKDCNPDAFFAGRAIFKRPYCNDFLKFCFERFDVGIWSSRSKKIIDKVVDYLLGNLKHKLLFCWDMRHSTQTSFKTLDNIHKPLVCKELSKVWDRYDPRLPWQRGDYDESNTLLLDDSPYKALLNPAHTAIFPPSYNFKVENDNSLGPGGDLRNYLEKLLKCEHVQKYVEQHPFGQHAIDDTSSDWNFYSDVLSSLLGQSCQNS